MQLGDDDDDANDDDDDDNERSIITCSLFDKFAIVKVV